MTMVWILFLVLCIANCLSYGTAVFHTFRDDSERNRLGYNILILGSVLVWIVNLSAIWIKRSEISFAFLWIGIVSQAFTIVFYFYLRNLIQKRFSVAFCLDSPQFLLRSGPYKLIRHPFYFCYLVNYLSVAIVTESPVSFLVFLFLVGIYYWAAKFEENKFLKSELKNEYLEYIRSTGMFIPKLKSK